MRYCLSIVNNYKIDIDEALFKRRIPDNELAELWLIMNFSVKFLTDICRLKSTPFVGGVQGQGFASP